MKDYQQEFIAFAIENKVLTFGSFVLKSGRTSPYFFNAGLFNTGEALAQLGKFYAAALVDAGLKFDVLFGPAYKGIPLVSSTAISLFHHHGINAPYSFNRKEKKDHGEGGNIVGTPLHGKVVLIDDVITAGTAIRESMPIIEGAGAALSGVLISLDRQEASGSGDPLAVLPKEQRRSAIEQVESDYEVPVVCIVRLRDIVAYLREKGMEKEVKAIEEYWNKYGVGSI